MENFQVLSLIVGFVLGAVLAAGGVFIWLSRQAKLLQQRLQQTELARQQGGQQLTQARKQVEQLQRDCHELRLAVRPAPRPAPAPEVVPDAAEATRRYAEALLKPAAAPEPGTQAFKDTVVLSRGSGD
ncbi:hypothetical protein ACG02S_15810 [Roseateles sp. DC23W]|uniref:DUF1043 family protein n=1 Tax=Pelomonas dachongensis TaxID=3299029 RepID=A0ABW7EPF5_9BURK